MGGRAVLHGRGAIWDNARAGRLDCTNLLLGLLADRDVAVTWQPLSDDVTAQAAASPDVLHVVLHDQPATGPNVVHCVPAYLNGFWYFDTTGTRNNSSLRTRRFAPDEMADAYATQFADRLRATFVQANRSKFAQDILPGFAPTAGAICIFAQDFKPPRYHTHHMDYPTLIAAVLRARGARAVHIKPHPRQSLTEVMALMQFHDPAAGVTVTQHSLHGLLAVAGVAVSLSSAVLVEAQMHHVPGIVAGQVDFAHNMFEVAHPDAMATALDAAFAADFAYDKFLTFFFAQGLLQPKLRAKALARMGAVVDTVLGGG